MYSSPMQWPWFAIAFALYPLLHIAAANPGQVEAPSLALVAGAFLVAPTDRDRSSRSSDAAPSSSSSAGRTARCGWSATS